MDKYSSGSDAASIIRECISKLEEAASSIEGEESSEEQSAPTSTPTAQKSPSGSSSKFGLALAGIRKGMSK